MVDKPDSQKPRSDADQSRYRIRVEDDLTLVHQQESKKEGEEAGAPEATAAIVSSCGVPIANPHLNPEPRVWFARRNISEGWQTRNWIQGLPIVPIAARRPCRRQTHSLVNPSELHCSEPTPL